MGTSNNASPETNNNRSVTDGDDPARVLYAWRSHPVRAGGRRFGIAVSALILIPMGLWLLYGGFFGLLAFAILGISLFPYFLPTNYVLYVGGLESVFLGVHRRFTWEQFRSYYPDKHGVLLSPFTRPSRLENFRGIYLRFDDNPAKVMALISERVGGATETSAAAKDEAS